MIENTNKHIFTFEYKDDAYEYIKQTLFIPKDVLDEYRKVQKFPKWFQPTEKELCTLFLNNGAFLYGENALIQSKKDFINQEDYTSTGLLQEKRLFIESTTLKRQFGQNIENQLSIQHIVNISGTASITLLTPLDLGQHGLVKNVMMSYKPDLHVIWYNDVNRRNMSIEDEGVREINSDIKQLCDTAPVVAKEYQPLAAVILPLTKTIEMAKQSLKFSPA